MNWFRNINQIGMIEDEAWGKEKDIYNRILKEDPLLCYEYDFLKNSYIVRILERTYNEIIIERI